MRIRLGHPPAPFFYFEYQENPGTWRPSAQEKPVAAHRDTRSPKRQPAISQVAAGSSVNPAASGYVEYPFPLRPGVLARLILPSNITKDDVTRLSTFMSMLVVGSEQRKLD